jgi:hypothetical protein
MNWTLQVNEFDRDSSSKEKDRRTYLLIRRIRDVCFNVAYDKTISSSRSRNSKVAEFPLASYSVCSIHR